MNWELFAIMVVIGTAACLIFYLLKIVTMFGWLAARSVSWHRWSLMIAGNGSIRRWWNDGKDTKQQKFWAVFRSFFTMIPDLIDASSYSRGDSEWRGIGDWNVGLFRPTENSEVLMGVLFAVVMVGLLFGLPFFVQTFGHWF